MTALSAVAVAVSLVQAEMEIALSFQAVKERMREEFYI